MARAGPTLVVAFALAALTVLAGRPAAGPSVALAQPDGPTLAGCPMLPADDIWNTRVDALPVHVRSAVWIRSIGDGVTLHADFGSGTWNGGPIGIPYIVVPGTQPRVPVRFEYADESDPGPYPIPPDAPIEGGAHSDGDRHILVVDRDGCRLWETWSTYPEGDGWRAGSGAVFDLRSSGLRPDGWTSADAAGLPILPGLARYDEVAAGAIRHAIRFTAERTQRAYLWPARHFASRIVDPDVPPMGARLRLKADVDLSGFSPEVRVILQAFKAYGIVLADNGSNWFISGAPDPRWDDDRLRELRRLRGADFEVVDVSGLMIDPDSGRARQPGDPSSPTATPSATVTPTTATREPPPPPSTATPSATPTTPDAAPTSWSLYAPMVLRSARADGPDRRPHPTPNAPTHRSPGSSNVTACGSKAAGS